jgi:hypothetical protein
MRKPLKYAVLTEEKEDKTYAMLEQIIWLILSGETINYDRRVTEIDSILSTPTNP